MRDDNDSGYKSTCANEETVDETGLPRTRQLAYELSTKWVWLAGLGWPDLAWVGVCLSAWVAPGSRAWVPRLVRTPGFWPGSSEFTGAVAGRKREGGREEKEGRKERKKREEGDLGEEEKRVRKRKRIWMLGFSEIETRLYNVSNYSF